MSITFSKKEKEATKALFEKAKENDYSRLIDRIRNTELKDPTDVWKLRDMLNLAAKEFDAKYDYRYSIMLDNFITFLLEDLISLKDLEFLSSEKFQYIQNNLQTIEQFRDDNRREKNEQV
ncbi:hypothetical protein MLC52_05465 [Sulfurimonas sp. NW15]|uniref:hypothetical protein n=1 Tax=Sulfurimonas sp. NW15 TaxID=2922729 RepID=UPI003DA8AED9